MLFGEQKTVVSGTAYIAIGLLLVLVNMGWYVPISRILEKNIRDEEQNAAEKAAIAATTFLDLRKANLEVIARALSDDLSETRNYDLASGLLREKSFNRIFLSDDDGSELFVVDRARTVLPEEYGTVRGTEEFTKAFSGQTAFGRVRITDRFEPVLTIAVPVVSSGGKIIGVLGAELSAKSVFESIGAITIHGRGSAYVVNDTGILIAHTDVSLVLKNTNLTNRHVVSETLRGGAHNAVSSNIYIYDNEDGISMRGAGAYVENVRWAAVFEDPKTEAERPLFIIRVLFGIIVGVGFFALSILRRINVNLTSTKTTLEQERNRFGAILASIGEGLLVTDHENAVTLSNFTAEKIIGKKAGEIIGRSIFEIFPLFKNGTPIPESERPVTAVIKTGDPVHNTISEGVSLRKNDGTDMPITLSATPLREGGRKSDAPTGVIITFRDVTDEKHAQMELVKRTEETEKMNRLMVGRELKMIELKEKIALLEKK